MGESWLDRCLREHPECAAEKSRQVVLPTRVINVGTISQRPFLHVSGNNEIGKWAALSYCWGGDSPFTLNKDSFSGLKSGLSLSDFPPTLRDAILVTRALGIQYLWIDSLCIFQDDVNDWESEASKMGNIYRHAVLTIAASSAESVNAGFLDKRERHFNCALPWLPEHGPVHNSQRHPRRYPIFVRQIRIFEDVYKAASSRWAGRGWTFQEELLSPRLLLYTPRRMVWRCPTGVAIDPESDISTSSPLLVSQLRGIISESNDSAMSIEEEIKLPPVDVTYNNWYYLLENYSARYLTYDKDCLPAIAGFAKYFQATLKDQYCVGLWKQDIIFGLLWSTKPKADSTSDKPSSQAMTESPSGDAQPSWSWISAFSMKVEWSNRRRDELTYPARIIDVEVYRATGDDFSRVSGGKLTLEAPYRHVDLKRTTLFPHLDKLKELTEIVLARPDFLAGTGSSRSVIVPLSYTAQRFTFVQVMKCHYRHQPGIWLLLLQPVATNASGVAGQQVYRRVALVYVEKWVYDNDRSKEEAQTDRLQGAAYQMVIKEEWPRSTFVII
jgi:hypothetical protein